jgi:hypothetical protein
VGALQDRLVTREPQLLLARLFDHRLGVAPGLGEELLAVLHHPARLLDLLGQRDLELLDELEHLFAVQQRG